MDGLYDLLIVGGGPAGLTAALYAGRARLKTLLIERMVLGGQASNAFQIENYPGFAEAVSGHDLARKMAEQTGKLGVPVLWGSAGALKPAENGQFELPVDDKTIRGRAVIIATGSESAKLNVPGEAQLRGRGVSYCATCDGPFYKNKNVIVVGGGNAAVEEALYLTRFAAKVSLVHRRDELRAARLIVEKAKSHPKIYFFWHSQLEEIKGEKTVKEVIVKDLVSGKKLIVPADGVFIYIGYQPSSNLVRGLVKLNEQGYIITDDKLATSLPGVFAAGDVRVKSLRQIVTAAGDGAVAAEAAREFLERG
ncbi:MAG: thioredoxin-disulfide reductase [Candidatus Saganbacteria bacterium]|nr:thioredoxin-disulfide reductase [Candidatus Saganbacteria bacterium]